MSTQHLENEPSLSEIVAENVRAEMARRRMSQGAMALAMGMGRVAINARCTGATPWTLDEMQKAAHVLRVPLSELVRHQGLEPRTRWFVVAWRWLRAVRVRSSAPNLTHAHGPLVLWGPLEEAS